MPSWPATRRASSAASSEQQERSTALYASAASWRRIQTPTTSLPSSTRSAAAAEESTPPDIATRTRSASSRCARPGRPAHPRPPACGRGPCRSSAQPLDDPHDRAGGRIDISVGRRAPEREPQRTARLLGRVAHREQDVRRLERPGRAGRPRRAGDALEVERHDELVPDHVADDDREEVRDPVDRMAGRARRPRPPGRAAASRSRRAATSATVAGRSRAASSKATAIPTAAATSSVPARR